jgi:phosphonate transport system substrate-binding protein
MTHPASIMTLKSHKVDIAATSQKVIDRYLHDGKIAAGDFRVIWTSPEIPNQPTAVRKSLPASFKDEIRRALLEMADKDPQAYKSMQTKAFSIPNGEVYVPANDAMFDGLRAMARGVKNLSLLEQ